MNNYWQVTIKIDSSGSNSEPEILNTVESPFGDFDDTAEPFGDVEDIKDVIAQVLFDEFSCEGVVLEEETFKELRRTGKAEGMRAFLSAYAAVQDIKDVILQNINDSIDIDVSIVQIEEKDWSEEWKKSWMPTKISQKIVIRPTWRDYIAKDGEIIVNLDPGMAFGTGAHGTTQLCVCAMEKYMPQNAELADIGCGSGILAICGVKLGAKYAVAVDNDPVVIPVAVDNATLNNVEDKIKFFEATSADLIGKTYDFVCANILHNVLDEIMAELKELLKPNGKMVLSGILDEKEYVVLNAIEREKLNLVERLENGHWVGLVVQK